MRVWSGFLAAATAVVTLVGIAGTASPRLDGEYGLWVEDRPDSVVVHWLTGTVGPGYLKVLVPDASAKEYETADSAAHTVAFARPRGARWITLVYGSLRDAAERDTTMISMQLGPRAPVVAGPDSVYILGDTHGEFDAATRILRNAGIIDADGRWTAGRKHLVFDGDLVDRGEDVTRLLWFVYGLEREAAQAGGRVHVVLGNHETMVWMGDLRYVAAKELKLAELHGVAYNKLFDIRESVLGRWLVTKPAVLRLDGILFAHGGISASYLSYTPKTLDDTLAKFVGEELFYRWSDTTVAFKLDSAAFARRTAFFLDPSSVFWFRGYVQSDSFGRMLEQVLKRFDATVHVVAHTPTTAIHQKHSGKLIAAHPRSPALELLLLVKEGKDYRRYRIDDTGAVSVLPAKPEIAPQKESALIDRRQSEPTGHLQ